MDRDSSVGIETRYGLKGTGIEARWRRNLPDPSRPALGPNQPLAKLVSVFISRGTTVGAWSWQTTQSSAEVKEKPLMLLCILPLLT